MENQKQCVSVRLSNSDIRKIKRIAERLNVSDSDVIRFGLKGMLTKLRPLSDGNSAGSQLLPVFLEHGNEVTRYFDFDAERLEHIINRDAGSDQSIERVDIELLAMHSVFPNYLKMQLEKLLGETLEEQELMPNLRQYLYSKYGAQRGQAREFSPDTEIA
jgi:Arc/MetJ-type ribon-helix-helix transcriptional regulator